MTGDPVPLFASLEVTLRCNGSCRYCGSGALAAAGVDELPTADWISIIDDLARSGCLSISLTGGEPLMRTDIEALAAHARRRGLGVRLNTNGRLLGQKRSILQYLDAISVSLDGIEAVNDSARGRGAFAAAVAAIDTARYAGVRVSATTVLTEESIAGLDAFLDFLRSRKIASKFQPQFGSRLRSHDYGSVRRPDVAAMRDAIEKLKKARSTGVVKNSIEGLELLALAYENSAPAMGCLGGRLFTRVAADGGMEVCGLEYDPCLGLACETACPRLDAREGVVYCMRRVNWPIKCRSCLSASRVELNRIFGLK